ncbi:MAG TPA: DUF4860 domain-containing protein [Firmicutes bacterium]|nr:DUF4860 domain-containing protein [Bacillota bacterium]
MMKKEPGQSTPFFAMALFAMMILCILGLILIGAGLYGRVVQSQSQNETQRACLSYVVSRVAAADTAGAVSIEDGPEGDMLVLAEPGDDGTYETRIYVYDGFLCEEYGTADQPLNPEAAMKIGEDETFALCWLEGDLLQVTTSSGSAKMAVHSGGEGS